MCNEVNMTSDYSLAVAIEKELHSLKSFPLSLISFKMVMKVFLSNNIKKSFKTNFNQFQPSVAFHIETSHLFCRAKQITGLYMKLNTGLKWVNAFPK